jgi:5-methylcytosine-specific restriction enzyme subunit McrC
MKIPIKNLYYLFCYAWARFPEGGAVEVGVEDSPDLPNLFGRLLVRGVNQLLRRGMDRGYIGFVEESKSPRGRLVVGESIKRQTRTRTSVICDFDQLTVDVLHNQVIKATARMLSECQDLNENLAHELHIISKRMDQVGDIRLTSHHFRRIQISRNTGTYLPLIRLCELAFRALLPVERGAGFRFTDIMQDEITMSKVFEEFLRNFYAFEQDTFRVGSEVMQWRVQDAPQDALTKLPSMRTDITMRSTDRTIVMDAKYYKDALVVRFGTEKVRSEHLYQMLAYLQHASGGPDNRPVEGILIYPSVQKGIDLKYKLLGYDVRITSVDLMMDWQEIHRSLLELVVRQTCIVQH